MYGRKQIAHSSHSWNISSKLIDFLEAERERKEEERDEKPRKEYQEFFLKLAIVFNHQTEVAKLVLTVWFFS